MSHASLRDQLRAVASQLSDTFKEDNREDNASKQSDNRKKENQKKTYKATRKSNSAEQEEKPKWLQYAQKGVDLLQSHFPACFKNNQNMQPLKVGIKKDLIKQLQSLDIKNEDKACMVKSLSYYVNMLSYHKKIKEGVVRIDLEGKPAGAVSEKEASYSREKIEKKRHASTIST